MKIPKLNFLFDYVEYWAKEDPTFPYIKHKWTKYNAEEFLQVINKLAESLLSLGIKKGDRIVTILPMIMEYVLIELAIMSIGAIIVPMDVRFRPADYRRFIPHVEPKMIILIGKARGYDLAKTMQELGPEFNPDIKYFMVGKDEFGEPFDNLLKGNADYIEALKRRRAELNPNEGALIIFTGGTTGVPKAAFLTHINIAHLAYYETNYFIEKSEELGVPWDRLPVLQNFPPSHGGGSVEIMGIAIAGGCKIILQEQWNPYRVLRAIKKHKITVTGGVPTMLAITLSLPDLDIFDLSSLKLVMMSGEKMSLELLNGIKERICPNIVTMYGSTEIGLEVSHTEIGDSLEELANGYVGKLFPEQCIKIVDDDDNELPPGEIGEMLFKGTLCIPEYYKMPEETKATFTDDGWCRSGDLGYVTEEGGIYIKGRKKFIIRVGSYTVLPSEVEDVAVQHPSVALAAAVGMPDPIYNDVVWLAVVPEEGKTVSKSEIIDFCKKELADFKVPKKVVVKKELPITRLAKVDRPTLLKQLIKEFDPNK